jgi:hypothetical protein
VVNDLENSSTPLGTTIRFSDAVAVLSNGMWGGLPRPDPVVTAKKICKKARIGFGPWRELAGQRLTAAALNGELTVYTILASAVPHERRRKTGKETTPTIATEPVALPLNVLKRLITTRGTIPDHVIRVSLKTVDRDAKLLEAIIKGDFVIREGEFEEWYYSERQKGKWPSQQTSSRTRNGRPPKQANAARCRILELVNANTWKRHNGLPRLYRLLTACGDVDVPSPDTLDRAVKQLYRETGHPNLRQIRHHRRRKRS